MKALRLSFALVLLVLVPACKGIGQHQIEPSASELPQYPNELLGFKKGKVELYRGDLSDYSMDYNYYDNNSHAIVDTFYYYDRAPYDSQMGPDVITHFKNAENAALTMKPNTTLVSEQQLEIAIGDKKYPLYRALFSSHAPITTGEDHQMFSELWLVQLETKYAKLRTTGLIEYNDFATQTNPQIFTELMGIATSGQ